MWDVGESESPPAAAADCDSDARCNNIWETTRPASVSTIFSAFAVFAPLIALGSQTAAVAVVAAAVAVAIAGLPTIRRGLHCSRALRRPSLSELVSTGGQERVHRPDCGLQGDDEPREVKLVVTVARAMQ